MGLASISACASPEYYQQDKHSLYYGKGELGFGQWYGEGAHLLGYRGDVYPEELVNAFAGRSPDGTQCLVQQQQWKERRRQPAWDFTMSVPKPVSVFWSAASVFTRDRIEQISMRAAQAGVAYLDAEAIFCRRGGQGKAVEHAKGVWAICPHGTSREHDPQLHFHCIAMNLGVRSDSSTGAIRSRDLYLHKMAAGAIFRAELAYLLETELGLRVRQDGWKFTLVDVPKELCREQSKRGNLIQSLAQKEGWNSPQMRAQIAAHTRSVKAQVSLHECFENWQAIAAKYGFTRELTELLIGQGNGRSREAATEETKQKVLSRILVESVNELSAYKAYFPERDLVRAVATKAQALGYSAEDILGIVKQGLGRFEHRVTKAESVYQNYSTRSNIANEKELIDRAMHGQSATRHVVDADIVTRAKAQVEREMSKSAGVPVSFTKDQESCLQFITQDVGDVKPVQGFAGTGKTRLLDAAHVAWKRGGFRAIGLTVTGRAAIGLQNATDIPSVTIDLFLQSQNPTLKNYALRTARTLRAAVKGAYFDSLSAGRWVRHPWREAALEISKAIRDARKSPVRQVPNCRLSSKSIVVVDEAAMVPTNMLLAIKKECDKVGAKLVLIGDRLQLPPIEAGGPFWSLATRLGHASLTTIVRQREPWMREAVENLIRDQPLQALKLYAANGALHLEGTRQAAMAKLIADYAKLKSKDLPKAIALTTTNEEASFINAGMQRSRKAARRLGFVSMKLPNGERVFKNDRILLTLNDYKLGVRNGFLGTVESLHWTRGIMGPGSLTVRLDDLKPRGLFARKPQSVTIDLKNYPDVQLGYAVTTHKIQGVTKESSYVLLGDAMLSKEMTFTQMTRASHMTRLYGAEAQYGDSIALIAQQMQRKTEKDLAHDHSLQRKQEQSHGITQSL